MATRFTKRELDRAWARAAGQINAALARCEGIRQERGRAGERCSAWVARGSRGLDLHFGWQACLVEPTGAAVAENCQILCRECLKALRAQGRTRVATSRPVAYEGL